ncbi:MAG: transcriptional regulator with XRE-family HTH domain [Crocinitomix sp.]|jgi:transcriptional regulator with XRE-family HTH domain
MKDLTTKDIDKIKNTIPEEVGDNIRKMREEKGLTQTELANKILSDRQYLYKIETGKVGLSVVKLAVIATALGVEITDLLDFSSKK